MKLRYKLVISAFLLTLFGSLVWSANHYHSKYQREKKRADEAVQNAESATAITNNVRNHCKSSIQFWRLTSMQNSRSHWSHREPRLISKWLLRMMIVLYALCLLPLLTGCGSTRTVYVSIPKTPLPVSLTSDTPVPFIPNPLTYGASLDLNVSLLSALAQCNRDKSDIRIIDNQN